MRLDIGFESKWVGKMEENGVGKIGVEFEAREI